jgi:hypothetical protein
MKSFFRLLFICFGLLLLLGISNSQYLDIPENPVEIHDLASSDFFPGIIPDVLTEAGLPKEYCTSPAQKEFFSAKCIQTRLLFLELKYGEYSHKILTKQGVQIHLQAPEDPLSLA